MQDIGYTSTHKVPVLLLSGGQPYTPPWILNYSSMALLIFSAKLFTGTQYKNKVFGHRLYDVKLPATRMQYSTWVGSKIQAS